MKGERPTIPHDVLTSNDIAIKAIILATKQCWEKNPKKRPSALEIRDELKLVMDRIKHENAAQH